jgi:hypothetical protein
MQPPAQPVSLESRTLSPTEIDWSAAWAAVLVAGVIGGFCFFLPLNFVWIVASGALAVYLYSRRRPPYMQISSGTGAKLGAVSGVVGYLLFAIVAVLGLSFAGDRVWSELTNEMQRQAGANPNANLQQMFEIMKTPEGKAVIAVFVMIFAFAFFLLLSTLGGAIGASLVQRNKRFL